MSDRIVLQGAGGTISIPPGTLAQIVQSAAEAVDGVRVRRPRRALELDVTDGRARVALELRVRYGLVLPELARSVQERVAEAVTARAPELDRTITEAAEGWTADRLGAVERNILRIGVQELEAEGVPAEVAINEAVELAKRYASEDAGRLVNGILGRVARELAA